MFRALLQLALANWGAFTIGTASSTKIKHTNGACSGDYADPTNDEFTFTSTPSDYTACNVGTSTGELSPNRYAKFECTDGALIIRIYLSGTCTGSSMFFKIDDSVQQANWGSGGCASPSSASWQNGAFGKWKLSGGSSGANVCAASVSGDPVTVFGGVERKFDLPLGQLTTLLTTQDLSLLASPFAGDSTNEQWIERVVVETAAGQRVLDISIRRDIHEFHNLQKTGDSFETIQISLPDHGLLSIPADRAKLVQWGNFLFVAHFALDGISVDAFRVLAPDRPPRREGVLVKSDSATVVIVSSSAFEYYYDDVADDRGLMYAHLDVEFVNMKDPAQFGGLLPEVWGVAQKTNSSSSTASHVSQKNEKLRSLLETDKNPQSSSLIEEIHTKLSPTPAEGVSAAVCSGSPCFTSQSSFV